MTILDGPRQDLYQARDTEDTSSIRGLIIRASRDLPKTPEALELFSLAFKLLDRIDNLADRSLALLDYAKEVPSTEAYHSLYHTVMEAAIIAADSLDEPRRRTTELMRIAGELPKAAEFTDIRVFAWRLALGLPDRPRFKEPDLARIAFELPKSSDIAFFASFTLLGIARMMPKDGPFLPVYREAIELAMRAALTLPEPYYKRYSLLSISGEIRNIPGAEDLYAAALDGTLKASLEMADPFAREFSLLELLQVAPKSREFFPLLQKTLEEALSFFTIRNWVGDVEVFDVVDYILSAEDHGITDSKKKRAFREHYSKILSAEIEKIRAKLNDTRFIETLKPYAHVWIQPRHLRDTVKEAVDRLEALRDTYHGSEVERPVFVREFHPDSAGSLVHKKDARPSECIAIDLGATNTVVMRKKRGEAPDFLSLGSISRQYGPINIIPTLLSADTNNIGAEAGDSPVPNIKQMLLEGNAKGREHMERFIKILAQQLRNSTGASTGWLTRAKSSADVIYITVPVGYHDYTAAIKEIASKAMKGNRVELIEEPLAAAVGYQVVDDKDRVMMVIDFGGSTLNTMVVRLNVNEAHIVAKPERAQMIGGRDIDLWLAEHLAPKAGVSGEPPYSMVLAAEELKIRLTERREATLVWNGREAARMTRDEFEEVLDGHEFYKTVDRTIFNVLKRAEKVGVKKERVEAILLTGGSSQIPSFKEKIGDIFSELRAANMIYDHSPLTAVGLGAALYGTRDITDRHLAVAYALRYAPSDKDVTHSYSIVLEKGEQLPLEKTFSLKPAMKLGGQKDISIELFEVPESLLTRRWVSEGGIEFLKQELKESADLTTGGLKPVVLALPEGDEAQTQVTFCVDENGFVRLKSGPGDKLIETGLRLQ